MTSLLPPLFIAVFTTSLLGSLHCVGMCGGLMMNVAKTPKENALYHLGRLVSYLALGTIAGYAGQTIFDHTLFRSFQIGTALMTALFFCWIAIRLWKNQQFHINVIPASILLRIQKMSLRSKIISPAFLIGATSGLLPCGWLHTFVISAVAVQSPLQGSLVLFFFWLGTLPALVAFFASTIKLAHQLGQVGKYSSRALALIFLVAGIFTIGVKCYPLLQPPSAAEESCPFHSTNS